MHLLELKVSEISAVNEQLKVENEILKGKVQILEKEVID